MLWRIKSWHSAESVVGMSGRWSVDAISYMRENLLVALDHAAKTFLGEASKVREIMR